MPNITRPPAQSAASLTEGLHVKAITCFTAESLCCRLGSGCCIVSNSMRSYNVIMVQVGERRLHVTIAQNGPRFQKSAPRSFEQPRPPPSLGYMMYPPSSPAGVPQRFPVPVSHSAFVRWQPCKPGVLLQPLAKFEGCSSASRQRN